MTGGATGPLSLGIVADAAGGLIFLLSDGGRLARQERLALPEGALAQWRQAAAALRAADLPGFGAALAEALLPPALRQALAGQAPDSWLQLQLDATLTDLPWELAAVAAPDGTAATLDARFAVTRQILRSGGAADLPAGDPNADVTDVAGNASTVDSAAAAAWPPAVDGAGIVHLRADTDRLAAGAPALAAGFSRRLAGPQPPRLLIAEGLPAATTEALLQAAASAGVGALVLDGPDPAALAVFHAALADGLSCAVAARQARAAGWQQGTPGRWAWFHGDGRRRLAASAGQISGPAPDDVRQITVLSCDLVDSTGLMHRLGDEDYSERLGAYHRRVAAVAKQHGGLADDPRGDDGFMCYFGHPVASGDAAVLALRAGLALRHALDDLGLQLRIGISTGRVVIRDGQPVGSVVHHAARLQAGAGAGGVLVSAATRQIAGARFTFSEDAEVGALKGFGEGGPVYRLQGQQPLQGTERFAARAGLSPFVGREAELQRLQQLWRTAAAGRRQTLLLVGEAGIGKSRLLHEFRQRLGDADRSTLDCSGAPEHSGSPLQPVIDLLRRRLQLHDGDAPALQAQQLRQLAVTRQPDGDDALALLGALLSLPEAVLPALSPLWQNASAERRRQRTLDLLLRIWEGEPDGAPVCLIVEDLQWIDPSTRALVQALIDGPGARPLLLLLTLRSSQGATGSGFAVPTLVLGGLDAEAARTLVRGTCGGQPLDAGLVQWLTARADGVPLFIEESARMAALLRAQQPAADVASALRDAVPDSLQDLLMARLDQLPQARRAAQMGSALGRSFGLALIEAVNAHPGAPVRLPALAPALAALCQAGLLTVAGEGAQRRYSFSHALLRDAAHQSLLERERRGLHRSIAAVLQQQFAPLCASQPELLALHQEQAGMVDEALAGWERAARHATRRSALDEAIGHLRRALALVARQLAGPDRDRAELRLQLRLASRLMGTAGHGAGVVESVYARALALGEAVGDLAALQRARLGLQAHHFSRGDFALAMALARQVAASLDAGADPLLRIQSRWALASIEFHRGRAATALHEMERCLAEHAALAPHRAPVQDPALLCLCHAAWALLALGRPDQALLRAQQALALAERLDHRFGIGMACGFLALVHHGRGETGAGLLQAQRAVAVCEAGGFSIWLAHAQVLRGRLLVAQGALADGQAAMAQGDALWAATGAVVGLPFYRVLRAEGLALAGRPGQGLMLLQQALALIDRHGERLWEPEVQRLTGVLLLQAGRSTAEAETWLRSALAGAQDLQLPGLALRSATDLARLWLQQGQRTRAAELLDRQLLGLDQGLMTRDLLQARALRADCGAAP